MKLRKNAVRLVASKMLESMAYTKGRLYVTFKNGVTYVYFNVPSYLWAALCHANSKGKSFLRNVRNAGFAFTKVGA